MLFLLLAFFYQLIDVSDKRKWFFFLMVMVFTISRNFGLLVILKALIQMYGI